MSEKCPCGFINQKTRFRFRYSIGDLTTVIWQKFIGGRGSVPDPTKVAYTVPQTPSDGEGLAVPLHQEPHSPLSALWPLNLSELVSSLFRRFCSHVPEKLRLSLNISTHFQLFMNDNTNLTNKNTVSMIYVIPPAKWMVWHDFWAAVVYQDFSRQPTEKITIAVCDQLVQYQIQQQRSSWTSPA